MSLALSLSLWPRRDPSLGPVDTPFIRDTLEGEIARGRLPSKGKGAQMRCFSTGVVGPAKETSCSRASTRRSYERLPLSSAASMCDTSDQLDCSLHYSDGFPTPPVKPTRGVSSFANARNALVHRLCGPRSHSPALPGGAHPKRKVHSGGKPFCLLACLNVSPKGSVPRFKFPSPDNSLLTKSTSQPDFGDGTDDLSISNGLLQTLRRCSSEMVLDDAKAPLTSSSSFVDLWLKNKLGTTTYPAYNGDVTNDASSGASCFLSASPTSPAAAPDGARQAKQLLLLRRTRSDMGRDGRRPELRLPPLTSETQRQSLGRQYSSPQPIKVRPLHRLPDYSLGGASHRNSRLRRTKGSSQLLRRSVSQPLDLDKSFLTQVSFLTKLRSENDNGDTPRKRRPSVGNLLSEDGESSASSSSEEEEEEGERGCGNGRRDNSGRKEAQQGVKRGLDEEEDPCASGVAFAEALWDHVSLDADELVFRAGDLVTVLDASDRDWWWGRTVGTPGWFPASFVRLLVNQEENGKTTSSPAFTAAGVSMGATVDSPSIDIGGWRRRNASSSLLTQDQVRSNVVSEILATERDYVKHLKDVVEGYLCQARGRPDMFSDDTITTIFGNIENLFSFHSKFLSELQRSMDYGAPHRSCIGHCFVRNKSEFEIYSEYCNNHASAAWRLQALYSQERYARFFEACRLLQRMIDISLDGFLLTPVQKICKYPLQLQELLKYTHPSHADYSACVAATSAMREVALLVNERRRRLECLEQIAVWQRRVEAWQGADLVAHSSQLVHQGEVSRVAGDRAAWTRDLTLFLFDHQLVYCKKDLLKRNTFVYRGRINTDLCDLVDIPDDISRGSSAQNLWKIHCLQRGKTFVFSCKTPEDKIKWMAAFQRERNLVAMDEASGFVTSDKQKHLARNAAHNAHALSRRPRKPRVKSWSRKNAMTFAEARLLVNSNSSSIDKPNNNFALPDATVVNGGADIQRAEMTSEVTSEVTTIASHCANANSNNANGEVKKKGHWFIFGGHRKSRNSRTHTAIHEPS